VRAIKEARPELVVIVDVCLCEYTSHGHCGVVIDGEVDNDKTLELLARTALSLAEAGADIVVTGTVVELSKDVEGALRDIVRGVKGRLF